MSTVYADIKGTKITDEDVELFISRLSPEQRAYQDNPEFRKHCAQQLVERQLFVADGEDSGLENDPEFIEAMDRARKDILGRLAVNRLIESIKVEDSEINDYYEKNKDKFSRKGVAAAKHILVDSEEKCNEIKADITAGKISFEDAAREHSSCPSASKGGDLGTFEQGQMVPEFDKVVFSDDLDTVHGPVKTQFGYHLILITDRKDGGVPPLYQIQPEVEHKVRAEKEEATYLAHIEKLRKKYIAE